MIELNSVTCGDCLELMKDIPPELYERIVVITDPPYGIGAYSTGTMGGGVLAKQSTYEKTDWDSIPMTDEQRDQIFKISKDQIIFGGNYFNLPPSPCWIVWNKKNGDNNFADCELAWTSFKTAVRLFEWKWQGMLQEKMGKEKEYRSHPTQKPLALMKWVIDKYTDQDAIIVDPFCGSGTTLVGAKQLGREYIGFDIGENWCEIARKRLAQGELF